MPYGYSTYLVEFYNKVSKAIHFRQACDIVNSYLHLFNIFCCQVIPQRMAKFLKCKCAPYSHNLFMVNRYITYGNVNIVPDP